MKLLELWFSLARPVSRRAYAASGIGLFALKYAGDCLIVYGGTGRIWTPLSYLSPLWSERSVSLEAQGTVFALVAWSLPFIWIGLSMTIRRAVDAGLSPWVGLLFFAPVVNYVLMLTLCLLPSRPPPAEASSPPVGQVLEPESLSHSSRRALRAAGAGALSGFVLFAVSVYVMGTYGAGLFVGTPFVMGLVTAYLVNRDGQQPWATTLVATVLSLLVVGGTLLLFALEGLICIAMALPIALAEGVLGSVLGRALAARAHGFTRGLGGAMLVVPLILASETGRPTPILRRVMTSVEIDAPPAAVWEHVIGFGELPPPEELVFRLGIAYPTRARLLGHGVGAVRHCEFSTGSFVEPITVWEPPRRLAFDVREQPPPMHEWSPYRHVNAPHLLGALRSKSGEFLLEPLPGGRTLLLGTTWYELDMEPGPYWRLWSDALIHRIHRRVLAHVKTLAETDGYEQSAAAASISTSRPPT